MLFRQRSALAVVVCLVSAVTSRYVTLAAAQPAASPFAACEPAAGGTWTYDNLMCLRQAGTEHDMRAEAVHRLRAMGAGNAEHPWPTLVLAHITLEQLQRARAIALYEAAAEGFARAGEAEGEVVARQNLANQFRLRGEVERAGGQVARAVAAAEASKQPLTIARAAVIEAVHSMATGGDVGRAHRVLMRADRLVSSAAPIGLRRTILFNLANASLYLGDTEAAMEALERHRTLRMEDGSQQNAATVEFNLLTARMMLAERRPTPSARDQVIANARAVLAAAQALKDPLVEGEAHQVLGDLLARSEPDRAVTHLQRCLAVEAALGFPRLRAGCLWSLSRHQAAGDPQQAERSSEKALSLLDTEHNRTSMAYAWQARLRLVWRTLPEAEAVAQSIEALDAIERLRSAQAGEEDRAGLFGNWTRDYQWLTGQLLQTRQPRLAQAFEIGERLRSRVLLERLAQAGASPGTAAAGGQTGRSVQLRIVATQRRLLSPSLTGSERRTLFDQLRLLELEQEDLTAGRAPALAASAVPFASLDAVQRALDEHEVMVWFSIAPWVDLYDEFGGGAWAITVTRRSATVHRLAAGDDLDIEVAALLGLLRDRGTAPQVWAPAARRLGDTLLGAALAGLPPTATRLIVVTDGALHRMPFEVLSLNGGATLGERFDISETPSATLWVRNRQSAASDTGGVLVLADPEVPAGSPDGAIRLVPLPGARREADAIARILRLDGDAVVRGAAASERFIKRALLTPFTVIHVAAHARADTMYPGRSAVFLAPGEHDEDGWLQPSEIANLDLRGRLVVLSACDSAEGSLVSGEGPLSLARAFFAAGARTVVATRWPLRDDDAAMMMEKYYEALADGQSVAAALRHVRRQAIAAGLPAAAWAGVVTLGDGSHRPLRARRTYGMLWRWRVAMLLLLLAATGLAWRGFHTHRHRAASRRPPPRAGNPPEEITRFH